MPFIPHSEQNIKEMLQKIGIKNIDELFSEIPEDLKIKGLQNIPEKLNEMEIARLMEERANNNRAGSCFIGAGAYEHYIPAVVWDIVSRGEFLTAYTPYQAEASQGTLQVIYEYQTMMCNLMSLDVSNASMYDGASALAEAVLMAVRLAKKPDAKLILIPEALNPAYLATLHTITKPHHFEFAELPFNAKTGQIDETALKQYEGKNVIALVIAQPNFFGTIEDVDMLTNWTHKENALVIGCVNPLAMALLKAPGKWGETGADIATGDGQPLGSPLASGGPYFGFMCCKKEHVRQLPGRIVGRTVDTEGKQGFVLTLQAREQHIRRAKATSNICSNEALMATAATIYMSLLGSNGLKQTATACHNNATALRQKLTAIKGIKAVFNGPTFHEFVLQLNKPVAVVLEKLAELGVQGGFNLVQDYPKLGACLLVCATETKTAKDLQNYATQLEKVL